MDEDRSKGFVVGKTERAEGKTDVWWVRVKDPGNPHNGKKLIVASIRDDVALARGLNVNFIIGTTKNERGETEPRAADVRLDRA